MVATQPVALRTSEAVVFEPGPPGVLQAGKLRLGGALVWGSSASSVSTPPAPEEETSPGRRGKVRVTRQGASGHWGPGVLYSFCVEA